MTAPQASVPATTTGNNNAEHYIKLILAAIPAVVAVVAPDLSEPVQGVLAGITALASSAEVLAHAIGGKL